jgi:oligopeptide/dipeptide ABC transporter ATP-binding protein
MGLLLQVNDLKTYFHTEDGIGKAVNGITFSIDQEQTIGIVGESGCGKSVTALSIMNLVRNPPGRIVAGEILYESKDGQVDIAKLDPAGNRMRSLRGNEIAMIFQEPMTSLNPVYTVGTQIVEAIRLHQDLDRTAAAAQAVSMLTAVGIPDPGRRFKAFPHELSGGMRQRVMIAMALSCNPKLLIADEPTTALDVTIQAQVLELLADLKKRYRTSMIFITHDLGIVANIADVVIVMYRGTIVEKAAVRELFREPLHPYTKGLLNSLPTSDMTGKKRLVPIKGVVPSPFDHTDGCVFHQRCPFAMDVCRRVPPELLAVQSGHSSACHLHTGTEEPQT